MKAKKANRILPADLREALVRRGEVVPETEAEVLKYKTSVGAKKDVCLPERLQDLDAIYEAGSGASSAAVIRLADAPTAEPTMGQFARAARDGKEVPPEVEALMKADRAAAESDASKDK